MVMIWNSLAGGDPNLCAIIVIINSVLQIALYSPMAILFIEVITDSDIQTANGHVGLNYGTTAIAVCIVSSIVCASTPHSHPNST
jgi:ACR3 family arsenite transporter